MTPKMKQQGRTAVLILSLTALLLAASILLPLLSLFRSEKLAVFADNSTGGSAESDRITQDDIDKIQDELAALEEEQKRLEAELEATKESVGQEAARILTYEALITNYKKEIYATEEIISAYDSLIVLKNKELTNKQTEYSRMVISYKDKLRFTHEMNIFTTLQMVFSAESFSDFLTSSIRFGDILDHTNTIMAKLEECALEIEQTLLELDSAKNEKQTFVASLTATKAHTEALLEEAEREKKMLEDESEAIKTLIEYYHAQHQQTDNALTQLLKDYAEQIRKEEEEQQKKEEEEREEQERLEQLKWLWPLEEKNVYITSTFGGRIHPVHNKPLHHSGIDVAGKSSGIIAGDDIFAAREGTVIIAGYGAGYGNYVVIDHGDDENGKRLTTVYAHCTTLFVKKGQKVKRGDVVGSVGMTGTATGYHLHFEIRLDGDKVDPLDYSYIFKTGEIPVLATKFVKYR